MNGKLEEIRKRNEERQRQLTIDEQDGSGASHYPPGAMQEAAQDIDYLLSEIQRLEAEAKELRGENADLVHAVNRP